MRGVDENKSSNLAWVLLLISPYKNPSSRSSDEYVGLFHSRGLDKSVHFRDDLIDRTQLGMGILNVIAATSPDRIVTASSNRWWNLLLYKRPRISGTEASASRQNHRWCCVRIARTFEEHPMPVRKLNKTTWNFALRRTLTIVCFHGARVNDRRITQCAEAESCPRERVHKLTDRRQALCVVA